MNKIVDTVIVRLKSVRKSEKKQPGNPLLQTYIASLMSLVLCVTMFLSTSYAWFTANVDVPGNQMYVGTLSLELQHATFKGGQLQLNNGQYHAVTGSYKILDEEIRWEPGYTAVEKFNLVETGDLAFTYRMIFNRNDAMTETQKTIASSIQVWNYTGPDTNELTGATFEQMVTTGAWVKVGSLMDVMTQQLPLFKGTMDTAAVSQNGVNGNRTHMIALHMDESLEMAALEAAMARDAQQGRSQADPLLLDNITISLVATQSAGQTDAFGSGYGPTEDVDYRMIRIPAVNNSRETTGKVTFEDVLPNASVSTVSAVVPAGVKMAADASELVMTVKEVQTPGVQVPAGQEALALDIKITGLASNNTKVIPVTMTVPRDLVNVVMYHNATAMTKVDAKSDAPTANTYYYNAATGELVLYVDGFSTFSLIHGAKAVNSVESLTQALSAAAAGETAIKLTADLDLGSTQITIPAGKEVTLDLNGFNIKANYAGTQGYGTFNIPGGSTLNVRGEGDVNLTSGISTGISAAIFQNDGTLNIYGGNYNARHDDLAAIKGKGAIVAVIDNCTGGSAKAKAEATVNIFGGSFTVSGQGAYNVIRNWPISHANVYLNVYAGTFNANPEADTTYIWNKNDGNKETTDSYMKFFGGVYNGNVVFEDYDGQSDISIATGVGIKPYKNNT